MSKQNHQMSKQFDILLSSRENNRHDRGNFPIEEIVQKHNRFYVAYISINAYFCFFASFRLEIFLLL